ncbi:hypothetical protein ASPACDRAFT_44760 [Aspergillus aculeatus ATCC 16872]|uniref:Uncharacterized protein n=1 Tax=Aspergillus aculeatus (strain ATCC 16872 / CBS 172.66 / WB 5094) TaxID=690307 RepID=A0A1L9WQ15_ASPA1|nr:uncharacterized protein ASPACDRAFT_44760 [Aspergillus aculeatus ATCC 16872]OJJ98252.1 hypothetical protein ASPACDRAFT_44760 [Aspergillus aculeatus ATCC 16872]
MRVSASAHAVILSLAFPFLTTAADDASYNASLPFRPNNVTLLHDPYYWVGSYYNGTTELELTPYTGLAANDSAQCPLLANTTTTVQYDTILALTEPSILNNDSDPVNAFLMLWSPPYRLSSTINTWDDGLGALRVNMTNCTTTEIVPWYIEPGPWARDNNGIFQPEWPAMTVRLEFDGETANYTIHGYFQSHRTHGKDEDLFYGDPAEGQFTLRFAGVLDAYHSDILANDTATPTWLRTVGFNNNSLNIGYTGAAGKSMSAGSSVATALTALALTQVVQFLF